MFIYIISGFIIVIIIRILYLKKTGLFHSGKGMNYYNSGYFSSSITECDKALKVNPKNKFAKYYKGMSLVRLDKTEEGLVYINEFLEEEPKNIDANMAKYSILFHLGVSKNSNELLNESLELGIYIKQLDKTGLLHNSINTTINEIKYIIKNK